MNSNAKRPYSKGSSIGAPFWTRTERLVNVTSDDQTQNAMRASGRIGLSEATGRYT
jgi:hypothetical protein